MDEATFAEMVARVRLGDDEATRWLVEQCETEIRRELGYQLRSYRIRRGAEPSDLCQSVLTRFFIGLNAGKLEIDDRKDLVNLLKEMVANRVVDLWRYWNAKRRDQARLVENNPASPFDVPASESSPSEQVARGEIVAEFLRRLTPETRAIWLLRREGADWNQVAAKVANGNPEAVRVRFRREISRTCRELERLA